MEEFVDSSPSNWSDDLADPTLAKILQSLDLTLGNPATLRRKGAFDSRSESKHDIFRAKHLVQVQQNAQDVPLAVSRRQSQGRPLLVMHQEASQEIEGVDTTLDSIGESWNWASIDWRSLDCSWGFCSSTQCWPEYWQRTWTGKGYQIQKNGFVSFVKNDLGVSGHWKYACLSSPATVGCSPLGQSL